MNLFIKSIAIVTLFSFSCSANPARFTHSDKEKSDASVKVEDLNLAPLELLEKPPAVSVGDQKNGIKSYQIGNLTLIHKNTPNNPVVAARLYLDGGVAGVNESTEGLDQFAMLVAVNGGSQTTPKNEFNTILDGIGASVYSFSDPDYSGYGLRTLAENIDASWPLFVQSVMEPAMPEDEITFTREQQLASIANRGESPDSQVSEAVKELLFKDHPYRFHLNGNAKSVNSFTRSQLISRQREMLNNKSLLLVVVGNLDAADLLERVKASFAKIASTPKEKKKLNAFTTGATFTSVQKPLPTHYILGYYPAPSPDHEDYATMLIATSYLYDRLFEEVRTKRNLTYAVSAGLSARKQNYGYLYVTAVDVPTTMKVIFDQVAELKVLEIPKSDLEETVNVFITSYYRSLETNGDQASFLAKWHLKTGSWINSQTILERIKHVTPTDIQRVSAKYFNNYRFAVVGKTKPDPALFSGN